MSTIPNIKNVAFYKFFKPNFDLKEVQEALRTRMIELDIRGTILLSTEGINGSIAGIKESMNTFLEFLFQVIEIELSDLKVSYSFEIPFHRTLVKVKSAIVAKPGSTPVDPIKEATPHLSPEEFNQWIEEKKPMVILDTRNDYEYQTGRFKNSLHLGTKHFSEFERDLEKAPEEWKEIPVVTFCTGGIRCEKAAPLMVKKGFKEVYQLDGGILNYFKTVGRGYFEGDCFVFDERVALDDQFNPKS